MENFKDIEREFFITFTSYCHTKKNLMIEEYENVVDKIQDEIIYDEIKSNLTFDYDSILDFNEEFIYSFIYDRFVITYLNNVLKLQIYNKYCHYKIKKNNKKLNNKFKKMNKIIQLYHLELPTDIIGVIKNYI